MRAVGIKILKNKLSEYVRLAAGGETILVTDRDKVVAEITPPKADRSASRGDAMYTEAVRAGLITPALLHSSMPPPPPPMMKLDRLMKELNGDREDR